MRLHWIAAFVVAAVGGAGVYLYLEIDPVLSWLAGINVTTVIVYGYDKAIAGSDWSRVPERLLLALALTGGSVGALIGMQAFRHKTSKASFRWRFWFVVALQAGFVAAYIIWFAPMLGRR